MTYGKNRRARAHLLLLVHFSSCVNLKKTNVSRQAFVFAPDRDLSYDHRCFLIKSDYRTAPSCLEYAGLPRTEHYEWTLARAVAREPVCRLHDWSPAEAARAWLTRHHRQTSSMMTVLLTGSSFHRQVFEAIACRWHDELSGGFVGATERVPSSKPLPPLVGALTLNHETCNPQTCSDSYSCVEFTKHGTTLRLCYSFYGFTFLKPGQSLNRTWQFCKEGHRLEDIDFIIAARPRASLEEDLAKWRSAHDCSRDPTGANSVPLPPILNVGLSGFLTHVYRLAAKVVKDAQATAERKTHKREERTEGTLSWAEASPELARWNGEPVLATESQVIMRAASGEKCERVGGHPRLPGQPDHAAKVYLSLLASAVAEGECCDPANKVPCGDRAQGERF